MSDAKTVANYLRQYNAWRRAEDERTMYEAGIVPRELGIVIDEAVELLEAQAARAQSGQGVEPVTEADAPAYLWDKNRRHGWAIGMNSRPQPAQQGRVPDVGAMADVLGEWVRNTTGTALTHVTLVDMVRVMLATTTPQPEADGWVKCSERLPHISDGDERCSLWVSGLYENTRNRFVMMSFVGEAIDLAQNGAIDHFMPTGLKRPQPPKQEDE